MNTSSVNNPTSEATSSRPASEMPAGSSAGHTTEPPPDVTLDEVVNTVTDLLEAKKLQFTAQWQLIGAEAKLLRQSVLVTALATLATFAFACVCWLIVNGASAVLLAKAGLHAALIALILLAVNGMLMWLAWRVAQDAFKHISVNPLINAVKGQPEAVRKGAQTDKEGAQNHDKPVS